MQSDQKVGLALGVLLIGVVAAFFFRNEPDPAQRVPPLSRAEALHREIAEKRLTPYSSDLGKDPRASKIEIDESIERQLPRWNESAEYDPFADSEPRILTPPPDPIRVESHTMASNIPITQTPPPEESVPAPGRGPAAGFHVVQRGDTLSSIAGRYLGSQTRFREIFEANRDQLQSADDLQVGMKLRIPDGSQTSRPKSFVETQTISATLAEDASDQSESTNSGPRASQESDETPKLKFTPSKRRPVR